MTTKTTYTRDEMNEYADHAIETKREETAAKEALEEYKLIFREDAAELGESPYTLERPTGMIKVTPAGDRATLKSPQGVKESLRPSLYAELVEEVRTIRMSGKDLIAWIAALSPADRELVEKEIVFARGEHAVTITPSKK